MTTTRASLYVLSIAIICYGYWGVFTEQGSRYYDEMAGMIPWFMLWLGVIILVVLLGYEVWRYFS